MELLFQEIEVTSDFEKMGMLQLWEVEKFPFKIRIGRVPRRDRESVFYWTVLGTYITPHVALTHGKATERSAAESQATEALRALLVDVVEWIEYAKSLLS